VHGNIQLIYRDNLAEKLKGILTFRTFTGTKKMANGAVSLTSVEKNIPKCILCTQKKEQGKQPSSVNNVICHAGCFTELTHNQLVTQFAYNQLVTQSEVSNHAHTH
jgi:hypothetical protein